MNTIAGPKVWLVADDYGLAPGVDRAIRELLDDGRLSGTGCMTLFPEWANAAEALQSCQTISTAAIGLHLTLTDFAPLSGTSALAPEGKMPALKGLIQSSLLRRSGLEAAVHAELDLQLNAFISAIGHVPHYLDGHQHVHFLPPVRSWFVSRKTRLQAGGIQPWLRGAPSVKMASGLAMKAKVGVVAGLALGFDESLRRQGFAVAGPLSGFYDWSKAMDFTAAMNDVRDQAADNSVVMCHPGYVDDVLKGRDRLVAARQKERDVLDMFRFFDVNRRMDAEKRHAE